MEEQTMFRGSQRKEPPNDDLFDVDLRHGTIKRRSDGIRVIAMGSLGWATLEKELTTTFVSGAAVILQRMGYSYGRYLGGVAKSQQRTEHDVLESLQRFSRESGWGELVLNGGDLSGGQARLVLRNCIFCLHIEEASEPVCYMLTGLIAGIADEIMGATHRVLEEKCVAKGDALCEVVVERVG
ncbi:MAG: V4R domain-containing protein [Nitrososphaerales archaeon]